ncbi:hypothetical protein D3C71_351540 [compost metagenome]
MVVTMQLDTRIPLGVQGPQIESPQNMLAKALQVRQLQSSVEGQERQNQQRNALAGVLGGAFDESGRLRSGALGQIGQVAPDFVPQYANLASNQQRMDRQDALQNTSLAMKKQEWAQQGFATSETPEAAAAYIKNGVSAGILSPEEGQRGIAQIPQDLAQYSQWRNQINQSMMTAAQRADLQKGSYSAPLQTSQGFAQADRGGNVRILKGPDGQPLMPTSLDATGQAAVTGAKKEAEETAKRTAAAKADLPKLEAGISTIERVLNSIESHPGKNRAVGAYMGQIAPSLLGPDAVDFERKREQLQGNLFLQAYDQLRGGGQITEVEGTKAESAMANMSRAQSVEQFDAAVKEFREVIQSARQRARNAAKGVYEDGATPPAATANTPSGGVLSPSQTASPAAARTVTRTGTLNGRKVVQYSDGSTEYAD